MTLIKCSHSKFNQLSFFVLSGSLLRTWLIFFSSSGEGPLGELGVGSCCWGSETFLHLPLAMLINGGHHKSDFWSGQPNWQLLWGSKCPTSLWSIQNSNADLFTDLCSEIRPSPDPNVIIYHFFPFLICTMCYIFHAWMALTSVWSVCLEILKHRHIFPQVILAS